MTGSGYRPAGCLLQLAAREDASGALIPVAKKSPKISIGGSELGAPATFGHRGRGGRADRRRRAAGRRRRRPCPAQAAGRGRQDHRGVRAGRVAGASPKVRDELPRYASQLSRREPAIPTEYTCDQTPATRSSPGATRDTELDPTTEPAATAGSDGGAGSDGVGGMRGGRQGRRPR